jgi:hypothetical protein
MFGARVKEDKYNFVSSALMQLNCLFLKGNVTFAFFRRSAPLGLPCSHNDGKANCDVTFIY